MTEEKIERITLINDNRFAVDGPVPDGFREVGPFFVRITRLFPRPLSGVTYYGHPIETDQLQQVASEIFGQTEGSPVERARWYIERRRLQDGTRKL